MGTPINLVPKEYKVSSQLLKDLLLSIQGKMLNAKDILNNILLNIRATISRLMIC